MEENKHHHKILIVDDDPGTTELVKMCLAGKGYEIQIANDGPEALEKYKAELPCLIILDIMMPEMSGEDVLEALRQDSQFHKVRVIILTASTELSYKTLLLGKGADDYITKPFATEEVLARIQAQLRSNEIFEDIEREKEKYIHLSFKDSLTGVYNRRYLQVILPKIWAISIREDMPLSCVMLDIDHFKKVNDNYSHQAGDVVLQCIAKKAEDGARGADVVARYGGEEFVILMNNTNIEGAVYHIEEIRNKIEEMTVQYHNLNLKVTISAGVSERKLNAITTGEKLIHSADKALYAAKNGGRNQVRAYSQ